MNQHLQDLLKLIEEHKQLPAEERDTIITAIKNANKAFEIVNFKLDRTEKVKRTTSILLEETIDELEQKRKAVEIQNRELEVEAALERVRSRSIGMRKSDELKDVIRLVLEQITHLNINAEHAGFYIDYKKHDDMHIWLADPNLEPFYAVIPYFDTPTWNSFLEAKARGTILHTDLLDFETKNKFYQSLFKLFTIPEQAKAFYLECKGLAVSTVLLDNIGLYIENFSAIPYTDEENKILIRFAKVFQQTYTRFLDLQKAEAQAREAQIEAALERVRSRTMAMHSSEELLETAELLFDQLKQLGAALQGVAFAICDKHNLMVEKWTSIGVFSVPYNIEPGEERMYEAWKHQAEMYEEIYEGEKIKRYYEMFMEIPAFKEGIQKFIDAGHPLPTWQKNHAVTFKHGYLLFITTRPFNETQIFLRFAKVFEQTYTRFLDLKTAEAQTREAQIEAALERVRSRTMGMRISEDLLSVVKVLYAQLSDLGFKWGAAAIIIMDPEKGDMDWWMEGFEEGYDLPQKYHVNYFDHRGHKAQIDHWKKGADYAVIEISGYEKKVYDDYYFNHTDFAVAPENTKRLMMQQQSVLFSMAYMKYGALGWSPEPITAEQSKILIRFAKVFEQTYTRFLDLQTAEAQARESQIQLALERVRARTMAMYKSEELSDLSLELVKQVQALGVKTWFCAFNIYGDDAGGSLEWGSNGEGTFPKYRTPRENIFLHYYEAGQRGETFLINEIDKDKCLAHYEYLCSLPGVGDQLLKMKAAGIPFPIAQIDHVAFFKYGYLLFITYEPVPDSYDIFKRFAKVFEQTYTRFLDLKKAEAQARESQIQLALERVRAKTMAMHHSDELRGVAALLFEQVKELGFDAFMCSIVLQDKAIQGYQVIDSSHTQSVSPQIYKVPYLDDSFFKRFMAAFDQNSPYQVFELGGTEKKELDKKYFSLTDFRLAPHKLKQMMMNTERCFQCCAYMRHGCLTAIGDQELSADQAAILQRFAKVFEQTYTRFLDLQKAEAQARDAQIEASLERVRSKTMAMHNSNDVGETVAAMFAEFAHLGIHTNRSGILILNNESIAEVWTARLNNEGKTGLIIGKLGLHSHELLQSAYKAWATKKGTNEYYLEGDNLIRYYDAINQSDLYPVKFDLSKLPAVEYHFDFIFPDGVVFAFMPSPIAEEHAKILKRFAGVFGQTYRRYLDLQKAEAQTREAQIEVGLERVRSRAMAMQSSDELKMLIGTLFTELTKLDLVLTRGIIWVFDPATNDASWWMANSEDANNPVNFRIQYHDYPAYLEFVNAWKNQTVKFIYELNGQDKIQWDDILLTQTELKHLPAFVKDNMRAPESIILSGSFNNFGGISVASNEHLSSEHFDILLRFAKVFDLTYTRFLDLQKAESSAKEAIKQAALDRIRAEIASMRTVQDLQRITPTIWNELIILGIPFIRCGIFIMNDDRQQIQTYLSTPDGNAIASFHLAYNTSGNIADVVNHWQENKTYVNHWSIEEFISLADALIQQGNEATREQYMRYLPADGIYLHFLPFLQGMLYVGNSTALDEDDLAVLHAVADAFSTAYARYEDFNKLEAAKQQIENTLVELKQAQQQLIQNEKMASLGELTAGIAHEIQNPLNFVNNFSDVSKELINEMVEEVEKGNTADVKAIAEDLVQNLEKINHHGQRAAAIVKGMLQHSRSSSGQKELTDINALCDEYLRLAYHGLRAKDKSFNAKFETHFDDTIEKINVVPQDIGRVILNLINNAFYAVKEKRKQADDNYEPTVTVSTKKENDKVIVSIADNGTGIPKQVVDKIFQPFFTTKPTGSGTGLGLSLSYDIVKAHSGKLEVETREGMGTTFIIQLGT